MYSTLKRIYPPKNIPCKGWFSLLSRLCRSWNSTLMADGRAVSMTTGQEMTEWVTSPPTWWRSSSGQVTAHIVCLQLSVSVWCVCVCVWECVCVYIRICLWESVSVVCVCMFVCLWLCLWVCVCVCVVPILCVCVCVFLVYVSSCEQEDNVLFSAVLLVCMFVWGSTLCCQGVVK